jgi:hypothetical protein
MGTDLHDDRLTRLRATLTDDLAAQKARLTEFTADTCYPGEAHIPGRHHRGHPAEPGADRRTGRSVR